MDSTELNTLTQAHEAPLATWRRGFLVALAATSNVSEAARVVGIHRTTAYLAKSNDESFAAEWEEALEQATDALELEARNRALGVYISYKFDKGGNPLLHPITGEPYAERAVSDALLTLLLKAHRPDKYKERSAVETTEKPAAKYDLSKLTQAQRDELERLTRAALVPDAT